MELTKEQLQNVEGGAIRQIATTGFIIGGIITFVIGVINGVLRPLSCSSK